MQVLWRVYSVLFVTQRGQYSTNGDLWLDESLRNRFASSACENGEDTLDYASDFLVCPNR